jgi:hypothetical protein
MEVLLAPDPPDHQERNKVDKVEVATPRTTKNTIRSLGITLFACGNEDLSPPIDVVFRRVLISRDGSTSYSLVC